MGWQVWLTLSASVALIACVHDHHGEFLGEDGVWHKSEGNHPLGVPPLCKNPARHMDLLGRWMTKQGEHGFLIDKVPDDVHLGPSFAERSAGTFVVPARIDPDHSTIEIRIDKSSDESNCDRGPRDAALRLEIQGTEGGVRLVVDCPADGRLPCSASALPSP